MKIDYTLKHWLHFTRTTLCAFLATVGALPICPARAADPFGEGVRPTDPLTPEQQQKTFHLPPGFEIQLVAAEPDLRKPMNMAFDAQGRLWVTESREYPFPAPLDKPGRDTIRIFSDFEDTGRARKVTIFADGLNIPMGIYPYKNGCVAWSITNIWWFEDTDGDGKADKREPLYGPFDHTRDTHGNQASFRRGFDGWLYATHGYNNDSHVRGRDGHEVHLNSGNSYRLRLDGSRIEHYTWGQVNPYGLCFDSLGNLFSADCHSEPCFQLLRGGFYPSFGKPHDGLGFAPEMIFHGHGSTAICGIVVNEEDDWPAEFRDNIFTGNVMTSRINRDQLAARGSTKIAEERPDFLSTDDPWFRSVDLQLGPDGAMYVADFYNRIIGHYEVPLLHPGRDRERGRIWRIVYRGDKPAAPRPRNFDLTQASAEQLTAALADANLTYRMLAMNQLVDRLGITAVGPVKKMLGDRQANPFQKIHGLWVLHRLGALEEKFLAALAKDADHAVRTHAMRVLTEKSRLSPSHRQWMLAGLNDSDAFARRAAADALAVHPQFENIKPLLALRQRTDTNDTHLLYAARQALRDQLKPSGSLRRLQAEKLSEQDERAIADVAVAVPTAEAGEFLLRHVQRYAEDKETLTRYLRHVARYVPAGELDMLATFTRGKFAEDLDFQLALFQSVQQGTEQRGSGLSSGCKAWGAELANSLLASVNENSLTWFYAPLEGMGTTTNPWFVQKRASADGDKTSPFLCSLPPGGEQLTGILRSKPFTSPAKLNFFLAGHDGFPAKPAQKKNVVRLRAVDTQQVLAETFPLRNDLAQPVTWDLGTHTGRQGFIEITDGDNGGAFAWLAVGRFNPSVITVPTMSPSLVGKRQQAAAELARTLPLPGLQPQLASLLMSPATDLETRGVIASALAALNPDDNRAALASLIGTPALPNNLRGRISQMLTDKNNADAPALLLEALRSLPRRLQLRLAQTLVNSATGAERLLKLAEDGQAPASLLVDRAVKNKLMASKLANGTDRFDKLTKNLPPANEATQKLLDERRGSFSAAKASLSRGEELFTQSCLVCHQLNGKGTVVGPQLDGIGQRGLERLLEDVLDPNRNVDPAFHTTIVELRDGEVMSGLFRREEGEALVLANAAGQEVSIPKKNVVDRRASEMSLMPDNVGEAMTPEDFNHLMAFLLSISGGQKQ